MIYDFNSFDFKQAFSFAVEYYLDPTKGPAGRTNSEPRGFGATLDAFTRGKLVEIGAQRMIENLEPSKKCQLDFEMKKASDVRDEPDIIAIRENGLKRQPNIFVEIKNTGRNDRWIGITEEQLRSMKEGSNERKVITIYISIAGNKTKDNPKTADFVGMYLKDISDLEIFNKFSDLNAVAQLEFILTIDELEKYGTKFPAGDLTYETELFLGPKKINRMDGTLIKGISLYKSYRLFNGEIFVKRRDNTNDKKHGLFHIQGDFDLYIKKNPKSTGWYIHCLSAVKIKSMVFGKYELEKGTIYDFLLHTLGRDPILKRNNLFIAKRRVYQLIDENILSKPDELLKEIAKII